MPLVPGRDMTGVPWIACFRGGLIHDPKDKAKSVVLTEEGETRSRELFERLFTQREESGPRE